MNREIQGAVSSRSRTGVVVAFSSNRSTVSLLPHPLRVSSTLLHCLRTRVSISLIPQATIPSQVQNDYFWSGVGNEDAVQWCAVWASREHSALASTSYFRCLRHWCSVMLSQQTSYGLCECHRTSLCSARRTRREQTPESRVLAHERDLDCRTTWSVRRLWISREILQGWASDNLNGNKIPVLTFMHGSNGTCISTHILHVND